MRKSILIVMIGMIFLVNTALAGVESGSSDYFDVSVSYPTEVDSNERFRVDISIGVNDSIDNGFLFVVYNPFGFEIVDGSPFNRIVSEEKDLIYWVLGPEDQTISFDAVGKYPGIHDFYIAWRTAYPYDRGDLEFSVNVTVDLCLDMNCSDGNPCTADTCADGECIYANITDCCINDSECDDNVNCTNDACVNNECVNNYISGCCLNDTDCDDNDICTHDVCVTYPDSSFDICRHIEIKKCCIKDSDCNDNNVCTTDYCDNNICIENWIDDCCITDFNCDDGDECTKNICKDDNTCTFSYACEPFEWSYGYKFGTIECANQGMECVKIYSAGNLKSCLTKLYSGTAYCIKKIDDAFGVSWLNTQSSADKQCALSKADCIKAYKSNGIEVECSSAGLYNIVAVCAPNPDITNIVSWQQAIGKTSNGNKECARDSRTCLKAYRNNGALISCSTPYIAGTAVCSENVTNVTAVSWGAEYSSGNRKCAEQGMYCDIVYDGSGYVKDCSINNVLNGLAYCVEITDIQYPLGVVWDMPNSGVSKCLENNGASCVTAYDSRGGVVNCGTGNIKDGAALCSAYEPVTHKGEDNLTIEYSSIEWPYEKDGYAYSSSGNAECAKQGTDCLEAFNFGGGASSCSASTAGGKATCRTSDIGDASGVEWEYEKDGYAYSSSGDAQCALLGMDCVRAYNYGGGLSNCYTSLAGGSALCKPSDIEDANGVEWPYEKCRSDSGGADGFTGYVIIQTESNLLKRIWNWIKSVTVGRAYVIDQSGEQDAGTEPADQVDAGGEVGAEEICYTYSSSGDAQCALQGMDCVRAYNYGGGSSNCYTSLAGGIAMCRPSDIQGASGVEWEYEKDGYAYSSTGNAECSPADCVRAYNYGGGLSNCYTSLAGGIAMCRPRT